MGSSTAFANLSSGSANFPGALPNLSPNPELQRALDAEGRLRLEETVRGVMRYLNARVDMPKEPPVMWRHGAVRLRAYMPPPERNSGRATLVIPSLINRYTVLDLLPDRSLLRYLASLGHTVLVMDWGAPGDEEKNFDCADYVEQHVCPALKYAFDMSGKPVTVVGYCMGGVMAFAAAALMPEKVAGLALLATPWDFHAEDVDIPKLEQDIVRDVEQRLDGMDSVPAHLLSSLFHWRDPWLFERKFRRFLKMEENSEEWREFVAIERWVNDGVPLTVNIARECLIGWGQQNTLARGRWQVDGTYITPSSVRCPIFAAVPKKDRIVPPKCALNLVDQLRSVEICRPEGGHVSMMSTASAREQMWERLGGWVNNSSS